MLETSPARPQKTSTTSLEDAPGQSHYTGEPVLFSASATSVGTSNIGIAGVVFSLLMAVLFGGTEHPIIGGLCVEGDPEDEMRIVEALIRGNSKGAIKFHAGPAGCSLVVTTVGRSAQGNSSRIWSLVHSKIRTIISVKRSGQKIDSLVGSHCDRAKCVKQFVEVYGRDNYLGDGIVGETLVPLPAKPELEMVYAQGEAVQIVVAADESAVEFTKTVWHEIAHVAMFVAQRPQGWRHGDPGVDSIILSAEEESGKAFAFSISATAPNRNSILPNLK